MTKLGPFTAPRHPEIESLRHGTVRQYESDWTLIIAGESKEFTHELGEIPRVVHVIRSEVLEGDYPQEAVEGTDVTTTRADSSSTSGSGVTTLTVTNDLASDTYFKVRAL